MYPFHSKYCWVCYRCCWKRFPGLWEQSSLMLMGEMGTDQCPLWLFCLCTLKEEENFSLGCCSSLQVWAIGGMIYARVIPLKDFPSCVHFWWQDQLSWTGGWSQGFTSSGRRWKCSCHSSSLHPRLSGTKLWAILLCLLSRSWKLEMKKISYLPRYYFVSKSVRTEYYRNL